MILEKEQEKLEKLKAEEVSLKSTFQRKTSLLVKISIFYLALTLMNLLIFWIATGANQFRLISKNAVLATNSTSYEVLKRLQPLMKDKKWANNVKVKKAEALEQVSKRLKHIENSQKLLVESYMLLSTSGDIFDAFGMKDIGKKADKKTRQLAMKAMQQRELRGRPFYGEPDVFDYTVNIFIPVSTEAPEVVFHTKIRMVNIRQELRGFLILAGAMIGLMLLIQTGFGFILYRMVVQPIRRLVSGAESVSRGSLKVEVPLGKKTDELGLLTHSFNNMVGSLKEKTEKLETTIEELEKHNEIMQQELDMAQNIQAGIMPQNSMSERIQVAVYYSPLEKVSGDYYDIFPLPDGSVGILITDASGHGVPAALVTIMAKVHFSSLAEKYATPGELFAEVNNELSKAITTSDYLTAFYLIIRPDLTVDYCNASHQKAIIFRHETKEIEEIDTGGFFIGAIEEAPFPYETHTLSLKPKDRIILYTDGMVEGMNSKSEEYGNDRFNDKIKEFAHLPVTEFNNEIVKDVDEFAEGSRRKDDYTLFTIEIAEVDVESVDLLKKGEDEYKQHHFDRAKETFTKVLSIEPGNINAKLYLANSLFFLKEYNEAIQYFEEYTRIKAGNPYAFLKLGVCYAKTGDEEKAIEQYQQAIQINEDLAEAYGQLAISYANKGNLNEAKDYLDQALQRRPDDKRLHKIRSKIEVKLNG